MLTVAHGIAAFVGQPAHVDLNRYKRDRFCARLPFSALLSLAAVGAFGSAGEK